MDVPALSADDVSRKRFNDAIKIISDEYQRLLDAQAGFRREAKVTAKVSFSDEGQAETEHGVRADVQGLSHQPSPRTAVPTHDVQSTFSESTGRQSPDAQSQSGINIERPTAVMDGSSTGSQSAALTFSIAPTLDTRKASHNKLYERIVTQTMASSSTGPTWNKKVHEFILVQGWVQRVPLHSSCLEKFVKGTRFDGFCALCIIVNSVILAISTNYAAINRIGDDADMPIAYSIIDNTFGVWFLVELLLRIAADGLLQFWSCSTGGFLWNYFDTVVVLMNVFEVVMQLVGSAAAAGSNVAALRMLRVLRVARALRVVRLIHLFKELRMMVLCIMSSFTTLLWALVLLLITMFIFGILLTQNVTNYLANELGPECGQSKLCDDLTRFFGSLVKCTYTLFVSVSGGISWIEISEPLFKISTTNGLMFCLYIFFTMFSMLNIISGIFLDTAMRAAQNDKDEVIAEQIAAEDSTIRQMKQIFAEADQDGSGEITAEEFDTHLNEPRMRAHLAALGIDGGEAEGLFCLLDLDNSGSITADEFLFGCMRIKGTAKAIDVATLLYENKRMVATWTDFMIYVEKQFKEARSFHKQFKSDMHAQLLSTSLNRSLDNNVNEQSHLPDVPEHSTCNGNLVEQPHYSCCEGYRSI